MHTLSVLRQRIFFAEVERDGAVNSGISVEIAWFLQTGRDVYRFQRTNCLSSVSTSCVSSDS